MHIRRLSLTFPVWAVSVLVLSAGSEPAKLSPEMQRVIEHVSADSLRGHLSFLASDLLEGRGTPSRGLDLAAEYIAAQFRRAGIEPAGDDGYFQTARLESVRQPMDEFQLVLEGDGKSVEPKADHVSVRTPHGLDLSQTAVWKTEVPKIPSLTSEDVTGKVLAIELPANEKLSGILKTLTALKPAAILDTAWKEFPETRLVDPSLPATVPWVVLRDSDALHMLRSAKPGLTEIRVSLHVAAPRVTAVRLRNVIGVIRGVDPALKDTYLLLTAHYDHLGMEGDRIFRGANDDGSGTASVVEIGQALATLNPRPRRTIVLMTFFGEEEGSLGALYYSRHPIFPLEKTVADLNLEQLGRTDSSSGPQVGNATITGYDFSDLHQILSEAGKLTGIKVYRSEDGGDPYFNRSDNIVFARKGIPSHTIVVAYEFPDYHAPDDTWQKVDYQNMAKVDRMIAVAAILIADSGGTPQWNASNPKAARYLQHTD